ncbi:syntaxin-1B-like [Sycon ciliatum]|uniref:syntaxin-1B-like n=1 Tax=Sycon ciliatum TaxID=27933 RepID=UPI0020AE0A1C|eukprot:scpid54234/ scgid16231/ Syntaxin-1B; Synaptocanalin I; Syntaxin-1B2 &gt; Syntaxin-1B; Syntaxin-1B2
MRDRLADLQRAVPGAVPEEAGPHGGGYFEEYPSDFSVVFDEVEGIRSQITELSAEVNQAHQLHNTLLSAAQPDQEHKMSLERLTDSIKKRSKTIQNKLKAMEMSLDKDGVNRSSADYRIQKAQHASLTRTFVDTISEYHQIQNQYRDRCKDRIQRQLEITGNDKSPEEVEDMLENGDPGIFTQGILMETAQAKMAYNEIQERHNAILSLETSIIELHSMFQDMAILVERQGEMIDRIEFNVDNTTEYTHQAVEKLRQARELQRKTQCCCCLKCCKCCTIL